MNSKSHFPRQRSGEAPATPFPIRKLLLNGEAIDEVHFVRTARPNFKCSHINWYIYLEAGSDIWMMAPMCIETAPNRNSPPGGIRGIVREQRNALNDP
jgi:hypothetical protein